MTWSQPATGLSSSASRWGIRDFPESDRSGRSETEGVWFVWVILGLYWVADADHPPARTHVGSWCRHQESDPHYEESEEQFVRSDSGCCDFICIEINTSDCGLRWIDICNFRLPDHSAGSKGGGPGKRRRSRSGLPRPFRKWGDGTRVVTTEGYAGSTMPRCCSSSAIVSVSVPSARQSKP